MILHLMQKIEDAEEETWESVIELFVPDSCRYAASTYNGWRASESRDELCNDLLHCTTIFIQSIRDNDQSLALDAYAAIGFYRNAVLNVSGFPDAVIKIET